MKVLEVTFIPPDTMSGGGRGILQSIKSIMVNAHMDYAGPMFDSSILDKADGKENIEKKYYVTAGNGNPQSLLKGFFHGTTTSFYESWVSLAKTLCWEEYDCVHIESSRYDFVVHDAVAHNVPVIIRLHNIERDYGYNYFRRIRSISSYIRYKSFAFNEKRSIRKADKLVFITQKDIKRAVQVYGDLKGKAILNPVCMDTDGCEETGNKKISSDRFTFLITGSLSFGPNEDGIRWFIKNVWNRIYTETDAHLVVAGSKPTVDLKTLISLNDSIMLIDTPKDMTPYLINADVYIAPIFDGAGMKVKVAEALSFGLPVIGTDHAWIGYEHMKAGRYVANNEDEFVKKIMQLRTMDGDLKLRQSIKDNFREEYSTAASEKRYGILLESVVRKPWL